MDMTSTIRPLALLNELIEEIIYHPKNTKNINELLLKCTKLLKSDEDLRKKQDKIFDKLLNSISYIVDKKSIHYLHLIMKVFLESIDFNTKEETFALQLNHYISILKSTFTRNQYILLLFSFTFVLNSANKNKENNNNNNNNNRSPTWLSSIIMNQSLLLNNIITNKNSSVKFIKYINQKFINYLNDLYKMNTYFNHYISIITDINTSLSHFYLIKIIIQFMLKYNLFNNKNTIESDTFLKIYIYWFLESRYRPSIAELECFNEYSNSNLITTEIFDTNIVPVLEKMLKKSPDSILEAVTIIIQNAQISVEKYVQDIFLPVIVNKLRSIKEDVRNNAIDFTCAIIKKNINNTDILLLLVDSFKDLLEGNKYGILAQFYQREAIYKCLFYLVNNITTQKNEDTFTTVKEHVLSFMTFSIVKESHEKTMHLGIVTLGLFKPPNEFFIQNIEKSHNNKNHLISFFNGLYLSDPHNIDSTLFNEIIQEPNIKPTLLNLPAVFALGILCKSNFPMVSALFHCLDSDSINIMDKNGFWYTNLVSLLADLPRDKMNDQSFVYSAERYAIIAYIHILTDVLNKNKSTYAQPFISIYHGIIDIILCPRKEVRERMKTELKKNDITNHHHFSKNLLLSLRYHINRIENDAIIDGNIYSEALFSILPSKVSMKCSKETTAFIDDNADIFCLSILLSHHPFISANEIVVSQKWSCLRKIFISQGATPDKQNTIDSFEEHYDDADKMDLFFENNMVLREKLLKSLTNEFYDINDINNVIMKNKRATALARILGTLIGFHGIGATESIIINDIISNLMINNVIKSNQIQQISNSDILLYKTPLNTLFIEKSKDETITIKKKKKKLTEDELWEEENAKKKRELKNDKCSDDFLDKERRAAIAVQDKRRLEIRHNIVTVETVLFIINFLIRNCTDEMRDYVPIFFQPLFDLINKAKDKERVGCRELYFTSVYKTIKMIVHHLSVPFTLSELSDSLSMFLVNISIIDDKNSNNIKDLFRQLSEKIFGFVLKDKNFDIKDLNTSTHSSYNYMSSSTLHVIFPIFEYYLMIDSDQEDNEILLLLYPIFILHFSIYNNYIKSNGQQDKNNFILLRKGAIEIITSLINRDKFVESNIQVLYHLFEIGVPLSSTEWTPLVNEKGLLSNQEKARFAILQTIKMDILSNNTKNKSRNIDFIMKNQLLLSRCFLLCYDICKKNAEMATHLWLLLSININNKNILNPLFMDLLIILLSHKYSIIQEIAAVAISKALLTLPTGATNVTVVNKLIKLYTRNIYIKKISETNRVIPYVVRKKDKINERIQDNEDPIENENNRYGAILGLLALIDNASMNDDKDVLMDIIILIINLGLSDKKPRIRQMFVKLGISIVTKYGEETDFKEKLLNIFEKILYPDKCFKNNIPDDIIEKINDKNKTVDEYDRQKEGTVVLIGSLAKHYFSQNDNSKNHKFYEIIDLLLLSLKIPSETVQKAISSCLSPLISLMRKFNHSNENDIKIESYINNLFETLYNGVTYGERIGAAFGISAIIKGTGILYLKKYEVIKNITNTLNDDNNKNKRYTIEGALLLIEKLSDQLGFLFEPYLMVLLPSLLLLFTNKNKSGSSSINKMVDNVMKSIMRNLSGHGIKLILPHFLKSLENNNNNNNAKLAAIQCLGSMAYCAPKQISECLPKVVPILILHISDTNTYVRKAVLMALEDIGSVIKNPEIKNLLPLLLEAYSDPSNKIIILLQNLQNMKFLHSIDPPSLSLLLPLIIRGLNNSQSGETKKIASFIIGNLSNMVTDKSQLFPYFDKLLPVLVSLLQDPTPEIRTITAKSLGMLVSSSANADSDIELIEKKYYPDLITDLLTLMKDSKVSSVERSGAAQGLCEILVATNKFNNNNYTHLIENLLLLSTYPDASHIRESLLYFWSFVPPSLGVTKFSPYIEKLLPIITHNIANNDISINDKSINNDNIQQLALKVGQVIIANHHSTHLNLLTDYIETYLFNESYRIRHAILLLLSDLLKKLQSTVQVKNINNKNKDPFIDKLGLLKRNNLFSLLYIIRFDHTSAVVRQTALQIWKNNVINTPKMLKSIINELITNIIINLSGSDDRNQNNNEKKIIVSKTLGELIRKLGDQVIPEIIPVLKDKTIHKNQNNDELIGVCLGLIEILSCATKVQLENYIHTIITVIESLLIIPNKTSDNSNEIVRIAAAKTFSVFYGLVGQDAIEAIVPLLLSKIENNNKNINHNPLSGLLQIVESDTREVLPYLINKLLILPLKSTNIHVLGKIASVSKKTYHYYYTRIFHSIIPLYTQLLKEKNENDDNNKENDEHNMIPTIEECLYDIVLSIDKDTIQSFAIEIISFCENNNNNDDYIYTKMIGLNIISLFCKNTTIDYNEQLPIFIKTILFNLSLPNKNLNNDIVYEAAIDAFRSIHITSKPELLANHISFITNILSSLFSDLKHSKINNDYNTNYLPGLNREKSFDILLPMLYYAILNSGSNEMRDNAAKSLQSLLVLIDEIYLKPYWIKITGPLIRIVGDRYPDYVKISIMQTLVLLIKIGKNNLKPFLPQLQTTFLKALNNVNNNILLKEEGINGIKELMSLMPKLDPLLLDLIEKIKYYSDMNEINNILIYVKLYKYIIEMHGIKINDTIITKLQETLFNMIIKDNNPNDMDQNNIIIEASQCLSEIILLKEKKTFILNNIIFTMNTTKHINNKNLIHVIENILIKKPNWIQSIIYDDYKLPTYLVSIINDNIKNELSIQSSIISMGLILCNYIIDLNDVHTKNLLELFIPIFDKCLESIYSNNIIKTTLKTIKKISKKHNKIFKNHLNLFVPKIFIYNMNTNNINVKMAADRALLYIFDIPSSNDDLLIQLFFKQNQHLNNIKNIGEYIKRVLTKIKADSDDES